MSEGSEASLSAQAARAAEWRIYAHAFVARLYFYIPILVRHMELSLTEAGAPHPQALSLSMISLVSVGMIVAEYPSGLLADAIGRRRTLLMSGGLQAAGTLLFAASSSVLAMVLAQVLIGVATAFRSGADTALLHGHLDRIGESHRYSSALSRLRFFNTLAIAVAGSVGGFMYAYSPTLVFVLSAAAAVVGTFSLIGLPERREHHTRDYGQVLRQSLSAMRQSPATQACILLGALGNPYFVFAYWVTQRYLIDAGFSLGGVGLSVAMISYLQAASTPLAAYFAATTRRLLLSLQVIALLLPVSFLAVSEAWDGARGAGAMVLVGMAGCHVLYRSLVNVRLQGLVPAPVRASVVSFESWLGAVGYLVVFPLGGYLFARFGLGGGFLRLSILMAVTLWPLLWFTRATVRGAAEQPAP